MNELIRRRCRKSSLTFAVAMALALSQAGCGGGGGDGNVRPTPPPPPPTTRPEPAIDAHLALTNTEPAHVAGFTGDGVVIGVVDSGVNRNHPALAGRVVQNLVYVDPASNDLSVDDVAEHGTAVSQIIAGKAVGAWPGGMAPGAQIVSARIINDNPPPDDGSGMGNEVPPGDDTPNFLGMVNADLIDAGVRVTNNSWGGLYWNSSVVTDAFVQAYTPFVIDHGGLVVFATGNEGNPQPSDTASLPSQGGAGAAALEKGWLAVGWLNNANPTQLDPSSNACGVAMNYCLVAPGGVIVTGANDTVGNPTYWQWFGTSLAAPQVTGAAALVWEAFPYFDNDLVRQTLLGGAKDLGAAGPDAVFGYGLLDVGKSIQGPSKFDWGDVEVAFDGITSTWGNAIHGDGGLTKRGTGTLVLAGDNTYSGTTDVLGGTVRVSGTVSESTFHVGPQGNLAGSGFILGNVNNDGTVTVQGVADMNVGGDYRQSPTGRLAVDLGNALQVGGQAFLAGDLHVLGIKDGYVTQDRETVLATAGGVTGTFANLTVAPGVFLNATPGYDATTAWLDITSVSVTAVQGLNYTAASTASAARVENAMKAIDRQIANGGAGAIDGGFIAAAADFQRAPTMRAAEASLQSLSGELHATADAMTYEGMEASRHALSSRFDALGERPRSIGMWQHNLDQGGGMSRAGFSGFDYDLSGRMTGIDMRLGEYGVLGLAGSQTQGTGWLNQRDDRSRSRQNEGQVYAGLIGEHAYLHGGLGFGRFDRKIDRSILLGRRDARASTAYSGDYDVTHFEAGWRMRMGGTRITPYLGSQFARIRNEGFSESGADGFGLKTRGNESERWQAISGLRADKRWRWAGGWLSLEARAEWQETLSADGGAFDASFVGVDQWQTLAGIGLADRSRLFGVGMDWGFSDRANLRLDFSRRYAPNLEDNQASLQYAIGF
ncbi:S8 family serine peptidase [Luteimonas sp. SX5]|uniref:S8 family serine peptidase n=1 Tax=Luteimonas galliterrae TaxID=2940486 RepID=A0ABT0MHU3_9GAMM|nr:autotransporter serine protease [Luteimonas galliterrae]MCL1633865.1 S8 family serine peptidase [Luteimonas galliterrae]